MNAQRYRVIFNKARGMLMVVSESARSQGKTGNPANGGSEISQVAGASQTAAQTNSTYQGGRLITLRSHVLLALGLATIVATSAYADATSIVADRNAAANQQATILKSSNGTTQVNIQAPSAAGVSRNVFSQFDVGQDGAILNNSRTNAQTQLAGWVEGNPYLARGEARVILNEVNSSDPSRLAGFTEIAGGRAELIIANPAGITCAGCGFINAARTTLTTGNALMDQGKLTGFDIKEGNIRVDGDGLDSSTSDYTQILAKSAQINGAVYANTLDVITGSNRVSYEADGADSIITPKSSTGSNQATGVALDVSALGAMYAGKIRLIGTDKGMGVTNAGSIIANSGGLQLDNDGNLINSGSLIANQGKVDITTKRNSVNNSGTIASSRDAATLSSSSFDNSGVISSRDTLRLQQTGNINNSGEIATGSFDVKANALNNSGKLLQTGSGQLAIDTSALFNQQGGIIGQDLYADASIPPSVIPTKKPPTTATNGSSVGVDNNDTTQPSEPNPVPLPVISRDGNISASNVTNAGSIYSNGKINIATDTVVNQGKSSLAVSRLDIANNGSLTNTDSRVQLENIDWQLANFDNSKGQITATNTISITSADQINNTKGTIAAVGDIKLTAQNELNNTQGSIQSNGTITTQSTTLDNTQGVISSQGDITLDAKGNLTNNQGRIQSDKNLTINAKGFSNTDGTIIGVQRADISTFDDITINSRNNNIQSTNLALTSQGKFSNSSKLAAQNALTISANSIDNTLGGELISNGNTALNATTDINNRGLINGVNTYLKADKSVNNYSNGRIYGDHVAIAATTLNNTPDGDNINAASNSAPIIAARERLDIGVTTLNNNPNQARAGKFNEDFNGQARLLSNGELHIGGSLDANQQAIGRATTVTNKGASIESIGDMSISTDTLNNVNADFETQEFTIEENKGKQQFADGRDGKKYDRSEVEFRDDKKLKNEDLYIIATNTPLGDSGGEDFWRFDFDERITEDRTVVSDPSRIIAGGVISLQGNNLNNDKSQLGLGEGFVVTGDTVKNVGESDLQGFKTRYVENGKVIYRHVEPSGLTGSKHKIEEDDKGAYVQTPEKLESYQLPILKQDIDKVVIAHDVTDTGSQQIDKGATDEIRSSDSVPTLPNSSLYGVNPDSNAEYLIETDPAFANYKNWLSSSYMLDRLKLDPNITQKRLGDGYYEQQYIRDQIMVLTGRYYLADYNNQDIQYKGLMDAGVTAAQTLNLRPGIALTASQVANLTTDIVWLVQQDVTLADGTTQSVLVPKIYTRQAAGQIDGTGNLIAANNIDMQLTGDLSNQGNIVGHKQVKINASNLTNQKGGVIAGDYVQIGTVNDLNNLGGTLQADNAMQLDVGGDLNNQSIKYNTEAVKGASTSRRTGINQIASIYVGDGLKGQVDADGNPLTTFVANVGGNTTFAAGRLDNLGGSSFIDTKGNVALDAVNVSYQSNSIGDANNYYKQGASQDIGSQLNSNNDLIIKAGNDVTGTAAQINSDNGTVGVIAGNDVTFSEGRHTQNLNTAVKTVDKGTFSTTRTQDRFDSQSDNSITSNIEGNQIAIQAGNNISLTGTNAISDKGTSLTAGGDIDILAAKNTSSESTFSQTKKSGLFGADGGMGFSIGKQQTDETNAQTALTNTTSNVAAIDGNVIIDAGGTYQQTGSNLIAGMGNDSSLDINDPDRGNTVVRAKSITIDSVKDIYTNQSESKFKQSGLTVSVSNSLIDSAKAIDSLVDAGGNTDSVRMKGMAAVAGALKAKALAKQTSDALQGASGFGNTRIQATIGSSKSQSNSSSYTEKNQGSSINTNNLALIATGAGTDSNININGSDLTVSSDALFQADNNLNVNAAAQNSQTRSNNKSSSTAIGGYADTSGSGGFTASASRAKGQANSDSTTYANSQVNVGGNTTLDIGNDFNGKGVVFNTNKVQGIIGGDMTIESLQDTATYDSKQKNMGFSADIDIAGAGAGSSLSVNGGKTNLNSDYKAVGEQSGIFANEADLITEGKGTFKGGVFVTSKAAQDNGNSNIVFKQGVTSTDLKNTTSYDGDTIQAGISIGSTNNKPQASMNGLGYGTDSDSDSSITKGGVSGYNDKEGLFTTDNREALAGQLGDVFDAENVNEELGAQTQITQAFDQERRKVKTEINTKEKKLRDKAEEQRQLGNTTARDKLIEQADKVQNQGLLFDAISSAIYGPNSNGATGYVAKAASPFVSNQIGQYYKEQSETQGDSLTSSQQAGHILAHGILGAAVSYATGNDALTGGVSAGTGEASAPVISNFLYGSSDPANLTAEQKDTVSAITSAIGLTIGATTGSANDAANAAETSKVAVENNQMLVPQAYDKLTAKEKQLYNKLEKRKAPELTAFLKNYESCNSSSCRENVEALYQKASKQFGEIVLKMVKEGDLSLAEVQMLSDNLANKFAKAADGEKGAIASLETNHWSPLGVLGYSQNLDQALALARYNYLVNEKGLTGKALDNALSKDEITQFLALDIPVVGGGGVGPKANKTSSQPAKRSNNNTCSFRGDMLVKTISGYRPISEVWIGNMVLSKNEITGKLSYQSVSNQYNNAYRVTVYITIKDSNGNTQTIVSNKIHPFFTQVNTGGQLPQSSEGHNYQGSIDNAQWIDASNLKAGYQLLSEDGQWQVVQSVRQTDEPLSAYNLTVDNDHTYFVTGSDSTYGVWVHNNCWSSLPDGATYNGKTTPDGRKLVTFVDANGKRVTAYKGTDGRWYDPKVYSPTSPPPKNVIPKDSFPNRDGARAAKGEVYYQTDVEAFEAAKKLGYTTKQSGGRNRPAIFINPKTGKVISRDTGSGDGSGSHVGGVWKQADSIDKLGSNKTRNGTFDANMQKIGK